MCVETLQSANTLTYKRLLFYWLHDFRIEFRKIAHQQNTSFEVGHSGSAFFAASNHYELEKVGYVRSYLLINLCLCV